MGFNAVFDPTLLCFNLVAVRFLTVAVDCQEAIKRPRTQTNKCFATTNENPIVVKRLYLHIADVVVRTIDDIAHVMPAL